MGKKIHAWKPQEEETNAFTHCLKKQSPSPQVETLPLF